MAMNGLVNPGGSDGHIVGKLRRCMAIMNAARDIIEQHGGEGLTMRAISSGAGVGIATP